MVASVRYLFTRDGKPFASAVLEDLDGRITVMVWPMLILRTCGRRGVSCWLKVR